jgi:hypothetical protein
MLPKILHAMQAGALRFTGLCEIQGLAVFNR